MTIHFVTIVLDGMPFIARHHAMMQALWCDWRWWVVEGVARPVGCTRWVAPLTPRLSTDGTHEYLQDLSQRDKRVTHLFRGAWHGKAAMFNKALSRIPDREYLLWQVDADEVWATWQVERAAALLLASQCNSAWFRCRYYVGPDLVITSRTGYGNHEEYEWRRLWKVPRGTLFATHEPPVLAGFVEQPLTHAITERAGLVFDHFAYATEAQVAFKERYYNGVRNPSGHLYREAVAGWRRLQAAPMPVLELADYLPWVGPGVTVDRVERTKTTPQADGLTPPDVIPLPV